jgi:GntR family transcriptional regulator, transcriptional repressor for pyruvate dehydrogenase complex
LALPEKGLFMDTGTRLLPIRKSRLSENAVEQIKSLILTKALKPGDRLPSERELAQQLSIGRPTIREALRILDLMGLIEIRLGNGTFVKELNFLPYLDSLVDAIGARLSLEDDSLLKLWEVRRIFELAIMRLAVGRMDSAKLRTVEQPLRKMKECLQDREAFLRHGEEFHRRLAEAAGNEFLHLLYKSLWDMIHRSEYRILSRGYRHGAHSLRSTLKADQKIFRALAGGDLPGAEKAMEEHLLSEEKILMAVLKSRGERRKA